MTQAFIDAENWRGLVGHWAAKNKDDCPDGVEIEEVECTEDKPAKFTYTATIKFKGNTLRAKATKESKKKAIKEACRLLWHSKLKNNKESVELGSGKKKPSVKQQQSGKKKKKQLETIPPGAAGDTFTGKVVQFESKRGFGFIVPDGSEDESKKYQIFVHWKNIHTEDDWPQLEVGAECEFTLFHDEEGKRATWQAHDVKMPGGEMFSVSVEKRKFSKKKQTGNVKFWHNRRGFGYITSDGPIKYGGLSIDAGEDVYVSREEIIVENPQEDTAALNDNMPVEFQVYVYEKKAAKDDEPAINELGAGRVRQPGGAPIAYVAPTPEERKEINKKRKAEWKTKEAEKKVKTGTA